MPTEWPEWWNWEILLSTHVVRRMNVRHFSEADLRTMLEDATDLSASPDPGRWIVLTKWDKRQWKVVVEPEWEESLLVVITAYVVE